MSGGKATVIRGPITIAGNLIKGYSATFDHEGRWISIVGESIDDVNLVWDTLPLPEPLDRSMVQEVVIGHAMNMK